jgi:hypothetical protein
MSISSVSSSSGAAQLLAALQASQASQPVDLPNDGDGDAGDSPVQAAPAPGTGLAVDKTA